MTIKTLFLHAQAMQQANKKRDLEAFKDAMKQYVSSVLFLERLEESWFSYTIATLIFKGDAEYLKYIHDDIDRQYSIAAIELRINVFSKDIPAVLFWKSEDYQGFVEAYKKHCNNNYGFAYNDIFWTMMRSLEMKMLSIELIVVGLMSASPFILSASAIIVGLFVIVANIVMAYERYNMRSVDTVPNPMIAARVPAPVRVPAPAPAPVRVPAPAPVRIPAPAEEPLFIDLIKPLFPTKSDELISKIITLAHYFVVCQEDVSAPIPLGAYRTRKSSFMLDGTMSDEEAKKMETALKPMILKKKTQRVKAIFSSALDGAVNNVADNPLLYRGLIVFEKEIDTLNIQLDYFTNKKSTAVPYPPFVVTHHPKSGSCDKYDSNFEIRVENRFQGYTVHSFLHTARNYQSQTPIPFVMYAGDKNFSLTYQEFKKLHEFLKDLAEWYEKGTSMLSALFGEDAAPYISTGVKPFSEVYQGENIRDQKFIAPTILNEMHIENTPDHSVLLIEQVTLNLTSHPNRDQFKRLLEHFYALSGLKDNKGYPKTFMLAHGSEYLSMLSTVNLKAISAHVMNHAIIESVAREWGMTSLQGEFYRVFTVPPKPLHPELPYVQNEDHTKTFYAYTLALFSQIAMEIFNLESFQGNYDIGECISPFRAQLESENPNNYQALREKLMTLLNILLDQNVNVTLNTLVSGDLMSEEKVRAFISESDAQQRRTSLKPYAVNAGEVDALVRAIKMSPVYTESIENGNFTDTLPIGKIDRIASALKNRLAGFDEHMELQADQNYYAVQKIIPALDAFTKLAYKICNAEAMGITPDAIKDLWIAIDGIDKDRDFFDSHFCNSGFSGRLQEIESKVIPSQDDPIYQTAFFLRNNLLTLTFAEVLNEIDSTQTAHNYSQRENISIELGLAAGQPSGEPAHLSLRTRFYQRYAQSYSPSALYDACYKECIESFQRYQRSDNDDGLYRLFKALEVDFETAVTEENKRYFEAQYKVNPQDPSSPWNIAKFLDKLPSYLLRALSNRKLIIREAGRHLTVRFTNREENTYTRTPTTLTPPAQIYAPAAFAGGALGGVAIGHFAVQAQAAIQQQVAEKVNAAMEEAAAQGAYADADTKAHA